MKTKLFKGLIAALISALVAYVTKTDSLDYMYIAIYSAGFTIWYIGKNAVLPSVSLLNTIDLRDIASGLILAIGAGLSDLAAQYLTTHLISWSLIGTTVWYSCLAYLGTKFGFGKKQ